MKVEKINNNKTKISLTLDELKKRKITLNDIKSDRLKAQNFFLELLEDTNLIDELEINSTDVLIEACKEDNIFTVTITKMPNVPVTKETSFTANTIYKISSNIFSFSNVDDLKSFINKVIASKLYFPECSLYHFNDKLFLIFSKKDIRNPLFLQTYSVISEYADNYYCSIHLKDTLIEHGTLLFSKATTNYILEYPYFLT